jgi:hypothetical protein
MHPPQIIIESFDSSFIISSVQRTTSGGLVVVGAIEIIVPLVAVLTLSSISLLMKVLNPIASVSVVDDVPKVSCTLTLAALIR